MFLRLPIVCIILYNCYIFFIMQFDAGNKFNQSINAQPLTLTYTLIFL